MKVATRVLLDSRHMVVEAALLAVDIEDGRHTVGLRDAQLTALSVCRARLSRVSNFVI